MNKLIAANWKMNKNISEAISFIEEFKRLVSNEKNVEIVVCLPFTILEAISKQLKGSNIDLGAQNMHFEDEGAFTGEISAKMLKDIGIDLCIIGHSERREYFKEIREEVRCLDTTDPVCSHGDLPFQLWTKRRRWAAASMLTLLITSSTSSDP